MSGQYRDNVPRGAVLFVHTHIKGTAMGNRTKYSRLDTETPDNEMFNELTRNAIKNIPKVVNGRLFNGKLAASTWSNACILLMSHGGLGGSETARVIAKAITYVDIFSMTTPDGLSDYERGLMTTAARAINTAISVLIAQQKITITVTDHQAVVAVEGNRGIAERLQDAWRATTEQQRDPLDGYRCPTGGKTAAFMMSE